MHRPQISHFQRGFIQYVILGVLVILGAGAIALYQHKHASPGNLTASLTGTGGVIITAPDTNSTVTSPVHVTAYVDAAFTGPVRTMHVFVDNSLAYQGPGTSVDTNLTLSASATHNLTVLALKKNGSLEGSATVYVTVVNPTPTPLAPPSTSSVAPLPPVPSP